MSEPALHPALEPIAWLLGTWAGEGRGMYPTITSFAYGEEIRFSHVGKPFLAYAQRTWALDDGRPLHAETGYWRVAEGALEIVLAHPTGVAEIQAGSIEAARLVTASTFLGATPSAKDVTRLERIFELAEDGSLSYEVKMAAVGQPLQRHLTARLLRNASF